MTTPASNPGETVTADGATLEGVLADHRGSRWKKILRWFIMVSVSCAVVFAGWYYWQQSQRPKATLWVTEPVTVGTLTVHVTATGNLAPTNQVEIGSELSGIVREVLVDENDRVLRDQVLVRLDTSRFELAVQSSQANLAVAQAQIGQAEASLAESELTLERLRELQRLSDGRLPARTDLDSAVASVARNGASLQGARASVAQARASMQSNEVDLERATILSPIDGVVLAREVEPGQTVAAALQAPVLFTIAEDLENMELLVNIDEADVGQLAVGQTALFTVDAWPDRNYNGTVVRVGLAAETVDGVVSYPAIIAVRNDDLSLRPGMTATAEITTVSHQQATLVPSSALRFVLPDSENSATTHSSGGVLSALMPRPGGGSTRSLGQQQDGTSVWVLRDGSPVRVEVNPGVSNGQMTEIPFGVLPPDSRVITEIETEEP